ncbi:MAG: NAD(P)/FAD-dependent oxidoreductase [Oscillospiraceae bacterium]|nr:NAD(P)/FAD-dependent oxidoreductase [Oscillospiraceae bacterium]
MTTDVIVVGGGAAGLFAAGEAAEAGKRVLLLEKNERLGKKLYITGKGRCNVTNDCTSEEVLQNVPRGGKFLYSAITAFPPAKMMALLERLGCPLKTERGNRVFPVSDRAQSVIDALQSRLRRGGVRVERANVTAILTEDGRATGVQTDLGAFAAPGVIFCPGGCSYPLTGSDGSGYALLRQLGHTIAEPAGSLVPLEEEGDWCAQMQGLSLRNVGVKLVSQKGKPLFSDFGELLFTHFGLSGPTILSASAHRRVGEICRIEIDLKPALDEQKLDQRFLRDFEKYQNRTFENALGDLFPRTMIPVIVARSGIPGETRVNSVTKEQRRALLLLTKRFTVEIRGPRPVAEAIVTSGGVRLSEVNPRTMESKLVQGLYLAGEILDADAYTGGFNLQIAWATAYAAASAVAGLTE